MTEIVDIQDWKEENSPHVCVFYQSGGENIAHTFPHQCIDDFINDPENHWLKDEPQILAQIIKDGLYEVIKQGEE